MPRGQKKWQKTDNDAYEERGRYDSRDYGHHGYSYWRGTWSPRQRAQGGRQERYDQEPLSQASSSTGMHPAAGQTAVVAVNPGQKVMQEIQKALTQARKTDSRIRKLGEDKKKTLQWESYVANLRTKYLRQKSLYEQDMRRMDQEAAEAAQQGTAAAARVAQLVTQGPAALVTEDVETTDPLEEKWFPRMAT